MATEPWMLREKAKAIVEALSTMPPKNATECISRDFSGDFNQFRADLVKAKPAFDRVVPGVSIGTKYIDVLAYARTAVRLLDGETGVPSHGMAP